MIKNPFYICVISFKRESENGRWDRAKGRRIKIMYNFDELYEH